MGKVEILKIKDDVFGNLIKMTNGIIELRITVDFGPRIIYFSRIGMDNMFYTDPKMSSIGEYYNVYEGDIIKLYGGHRIWASPEIMPNCYYPDNNPVEYKELPNGKGVEFIPSVEKFNNIQKILTVELDEDQPCVSLKHTIKNCGAWDIELAPWVITMLAADGKAIMPIPDRKTGYLHNKSFSFWDYSEMNDPRLYFGKDYLALTQDTSKSNPFKMGYNNEKGWAAYFNKGQVFIKIFEPETDGYYPDNGCCFETYTCDFMLEMETLGELQIIAPNESAEHTEKWELYEESSVPSNNDEDIKKTIRKHIS